MSQNKNYIKEFKYTLQSKDGKILLQSIVAFGNEETPFPINWKEDVVIQVALENYKEKLIKKHFDVKISEKLDFDI